MIQTIRNAWKIPDLRKRILFTLLILMIFRLGSFIAVPYIDTKVLAEAIQKNSVLGLLNVISGDNFSRFSIFAMGISPYITAQIIVQLLAMAIPALERLQKEGEEGTKKIAQYTRFAAIILAGVQALGTTLGFGDLLTVKTTYTVILVTTVIVAGTALVLWLGELITERGIGNGISMIIFVGIISGIPGSLGSVASGVSSGELSIFWIPGLIVFIILSILGVIAVQEGSRKIPVQYAKRVVGRKVYGGRNTHLPMKVNQSGVIPIIFAQTITLFPAQLASFFPNSGAMNWIAKTFAFGRPITTVLYVLLIIAFSFFYTIATFNPQDVAENLQQYGGFIPGIRPGKPTVLFLTKILNRLTMSGAVFLSVIAVIPIIVSSVLGAGISLEFTGTSLLIVVGVALETVQQLEQQLIMRNYKGFLK